jgi:hypothetical protein
MVLDEISTLMITKSSGSAARADSATAAVI